MNGSKRFWDNRAKKYDKKPDKQFYNSVVEKNRRHLRQSDCVLDYACGTGTIYKKLGFVQTKPEQLLNGIRFVPMVKNLRR